MPPECPKAECTVAATGRCFLNYEADKCPVRLGEPVEVEEAPDIANELEELPADTDVEDRAEVDVAEAVAALPERQATHFQLSPGSELGLETLGELRRRHRVIMVGILGAPDAGKTAALVSLYLLAATDKLAGFKFRNSKSLMAFELLARGAREWDPDGNMRKQLTNRTTLKEPRRPGFLHLRFEHESRGNTVDLAFPDLPGEWTDSLVERSDHDRLTFLKNADAVWVIVDGEKLASGKQGPGLTHSTQILLSRLKAFLEPRAGTPVLLVVTRRDKVPNLPELLVKKIEAEAEKQGLTLRVLRIASFSENPEDTPPGSGLSELLEETLVYAPEVRRSDSNVPRTDDREMLNYRTADVTNG